MQLAGLYIYTPVYQRLEGIFNHSKQPLNQVIHDHFSKSLSTRKKIDLTQPGLLPGFSQHDFDLKNVKPDQLVVVHCTDFLDTKTANILTPRDSGNHLRWTVHTSLNHSVATHSGGNWEDKAYVILSPLNKMLKKNGAPVCLKTEDTFWDHSLDINDEHTVVLVAASTLPENLKGRLEISSEFAYELKPEELGYQPGIKLKAFAVQNPYKAADVMVEKMGRTRTDKEGVFQLPEVVPAFNFTKAFEEERSKLDMSDPEYWDKLEKVLEDLAKKDTEDVFGSSHQRILHSRKVADLGASLGSKGLYHTQTAYSGIDDIIQHVNSLTKFGSDWEVNGKNYKEQILLKLKSLNSKELSKELGSVSTDAQACIDIISKADNPSKASNQLLRHFKVKNLVQSQESFSSDRFNNAIQPLSQEEQIKLLTEYLERNGTWSVA